MIWDILLVLGGVLIGTVIGMLIAGFVSNRELSQAWEAGKERGQHEASQLRDQMQRRINRLESANRRIQLYGEANR